MKYLGVFVLVLASFFILSETKTDFLLAEYGTLGSKADFYDEEFLQGGSTSLETDGPCKNLPRRWRKKPVSVDTRGTCFSACDDVDCGGTCKRVYPPNGEQQLSTIGLAKKIVSIQGCFYTGKSKQGSGGQPARPAARDDYEE